MYTCATQVIRGTLRTSFVCFQPTVKNFCVNGGLRRLSAVAFFISIFKWMASFSQKDYFGESCAVAKRVGTEWGKGAGLSLQQTLMSLK